MIDLLRLRCAYFVLAFFWIVLIGWLFVPGILKAAKGGPFHMFPSPSLPPMKPEEVVRRLMQELIVKALGLGVILPGIINAFLFVLIPGMFRKR